MVFRGRNPDGQRKAMFASLASRYKNFPSNFITPDVIRVRFLEKQGKVVELSTGRGILDEKPIFGVSVLRRDDTKKFGLTSSREGQAFKDRKKADLFFEKQIRVKKDTRTEMRFIDITTPKKMRAEIRRLKKRGEI